MCIRVRLVLDEPTLGLDILYRNAFYDQLLNDYFDHDTSIIISTHQVEEIETLLSHLLFIDHGKIVLDSPMDAVADKFSEVIVKPALLVMYLIQILCCRRCTLFSLLYSIHTYTNITILYSFTI